MLDFGHKHRHDPTEPQLATMVDVFSILIIFLIFGTAMDSTLINLPSDFMVPKTISDGAVANAPQVTVYDSEFELSLSERKYPLSLITDGFEDSNPMIQELKQVVSAYREKSKNIRKSANGAPSENGEEFNYLNLVADKSATYDKLFPVIKFFKAIGYSNVNLVGTPK